jgi:hypothetical protein
MRDELPGSRNVSRPSLAWRFRPSKRRVLKSDHQTSSARAISFRSTVSVLGAQQYVSILQQANGPVTLITRVPYGNAEPKRLSVFVVLQIRISLHMECRRLTRLTNAFSKKLASLESVGCAPFAFTTVLWGFTDAENDASDRRWCDGSAMVGLKICWRRPHEQVNPNHSQQCAESDKTRMLGPGFSFNPDGWNGFRRNAAVLPARQRSNCSRLPDVSVSGDAPSVSIVGSAFRALDFMR